MTDEARRCADFSLSRRGNSQFPDGLAGRVPVLGSAIAGLVSLVSEYQPRPLSRGQRSGQSSAVSRPYHHSYSWYMALRKSWRMLRSLQRVIGQGHVPVPTNEAPSAVLVVARGGAVGRCRNQRLLRSVRIQSGTRLFIAIHGKLLTAGPSPDAAIRRGSSIARSRWNKVSF